MGEVTPANVARPKRVVAKTVKPEEVEVAKRKVVTKMYTELDGDDMDTMLNQLGTILCGDKQYALTIMIEEILDD